MPRMSIELLSKCTGQAKRKRDESLEQFLRRITHLYCSEKAIETIVSQLCTNAAYIDVYCAINGVVLIALTLFVFLFFFLQEGLSVCRNLTVLYLYDNRISCIENLSTCTSLTHLYLQNNNISSIRNLAPLYRLSKL